MKLLHQKSIPLGLLKVSIKNSLNMFLVTVRRIFVYSEIESATTLHLKER